MYMGAMPGMKSGDVVGHEFMGIVEAVGPNVKGIKEGNYTNRRVSLSIYMHTHIFFLSPSNFSLGHLVCFLALSFCIPSLHGHQSFPTLH